MKILTKQIPNVLGMEETDLKCRPQLCGLRRSKRRIPKSYKKRLSLVLTMENITANTPDLKCYNEIGSNLSVFHHSTLHTCYM